MGAAFRPALPGGRPPRTSALALVRRSSGPIASRAGDQCIPDSGRSRPASHPPNRGRAGGV